MLASLRDFASRRTDIFADDETEVGSRLGETRKKEVRPTWDGHVASARSVAVEALGGKSIEEQVRARKDKALSDKSFGPYVFPI